MKWFSYALLFPLMMRPIPLMGAGEDLLTDVLVEAQLAFDQFNDTKTIKLLEPALKNFSELTKPSPAELIALNDAHLLLAQAQLNFGRTRAARSTLLELLRYNPIVQVNPVTYSPKLMRMVEQEKRAQAHQALHPIRINTLPSGAHVFLNGTYRGRAPIIIEGLASGHHYISTQKGDLNALTRVNVKGGTLTDVKIRLHRDRVNPFE